MTDLTGPDIRDIEIEPLARLIGRVEAEHHKQGWRVNPMTVYAIFDTHDKNTADLITSVMSSMGAPIVAGRYGAQPMIGARMFAQAGSPAWEAFFHFAHNIAFVDTDVLAGRDDVPDATYLSEGLRAMRALFQVPGIIGFAACFEGHGLSEMSPALMERVFEGAETFDTAPGAREGRMLLLVDAGDYVHKLHRVRGHEPVIEMFAPVRGDTSNSLRKLMDLAMDRRPTSQEEADARYTRASRKGGFAFQAGTNQPSV